MTTKNLFVIQTNEKKVIMIDENGLEYLFPKEIFSQITTGEKLQIKITTSSSNVDDDDLAKKFLNEILTG